MKKKIKFASPERMAARFVLQDYDVAEPWTVLSGQEAQAAINNAKACEEVVIGTERSVLSDHVVRDANNLVFVFLRDYVS